MAEPLQIYALLIGLIYLASNFLGYYLTEDFTGITAGIALATVINYYGRDIILGIAGGMT